MDRSDAYDRGANVCPIDQLRPGPLHQLYIEGLSAVGAPSRGSCTSRAFRMSSP